MRNRLMDWQTDRLTDWQTDRLTDWQTDRLTDWQTDRLTDWQTDRLTDWQTDRLTDWQTLSLTDRRTGGHTVRKLDRQMGGQIGKRTKGRSVGQCQVSWIQGDADFGIESSFFGSDCVGMNSGKNLIPWTLTFCHWNGIYNGNFSPFLLLKMALT